MQKEQPTICEPCGGNQDAISTEKSGALTKDYKFRNFREAWAFMELIAKKAEEMNVSLLLSGCLVF